MTDPSTRWQRRVFLPAFAIFLILTMVNCSTTSNPASQNEAEHSSHATETTSLSLPQLSPANLGTDRLQVVATTSIIGDIVSQVGGDVIDLTVLMQPGQDPHTYEPTARALTVVSQAHIIFVNGWNLEEGLVNDLKNVAANVPIAPISANITPLTFGEQANHHEDAHDHDHEHGTPDPHVWLSISNVEQWVKNSQIVLTQLDPKNEAVYQNNASDYLIALNSLADYANNRLEQIPPDNKKIVTNHDAIAYFANDYNFTTIGTIIPNFSTGAEPSVRDIATLVTTMKAENVCAIFTETTISDDLAKTVANELDNCDNVQIIKLYTGALGPPESGADTYIGMFKANVDAFVTGLTKTNNP